MKIHRNLARAVAEGVDQIFNQGLQADDVVEKILRSNRKWGARDRQFVAENIYEIVRNYRLLSYGTQSTNPYHLLAAKLSSEGVAIPEWEEFTGFSIIEPDEQLRRAIRFSIPDWLDALGVQEMGEACWEREMQAMHCPAPICLRVNTLFADAATAVSELLKEGIETEHGPVPDSLIVKGKKNVIQTSAYRNGLVEIQDVNSQRIAPLLAPQPGEFVIDACAGAGGKTLHMAALAGNEAKILAMDVSVTKLETLSKRAKRAGAKGIEITIADSSKLGKFKGKADKLLLDVPCSGTGVFRRKPDSKYKLSAHMLEAVRQQQEIILENYSAVLRPGGTMVYATCSILPSENQLQIKNFLERNKGFSLIREEYFSPALTGFDGFYAAVMVKEG
ncbi:MAG: RsmB/NOP family class I SAM-dependent RNA methyltransferase [Chitinophagales bacterium]|nr:RsmB/NOP family class I SAM-dependent RNA methyltransferase [Chitinophagales bacterium]MDW8273856.1 RsmB/NOP family class I SAM-dependent RNA methyltransferase [Chitinophagales bacterium]